MALREKEKNFLELHKITHQLHGLNDSYLEFGSPLKTSKAAKSKIQKKIIWER